MKKQLAMPNDLIGFVSNGLRRGCHGKKNGTNNMFAEMISDMVSDLGTAIRNFIVAHTDEEFMEMSHKVAQVSRSIMTPILGGTERSS
jgi:hypothetical protein